MKKILIATILLIGIIGNTQAQSYYRQAVGLRINNGYGGLTYKYFTSNSKALDLTLNIAFESGIGLTGLCEIHKTTGFVPRLSWYYGYGAHAFLGGKGDGSTISLGVDGVLGLEFVASEIPFAFSLDYIPSLSLINTSAGEGDTSFEGNFSNWTFGIKYTFIKSDLENKRKEVIKKESSPK